MSTMMRTVSNLNTRSLLSLTSQGGFRKHHSVRHQQKCVDKGHVGRCSRWIHSCQLAWGSLGFPPFQFDPDALLRSQDELSDRPQLLTCLTGFDVKVTQNVRQHHLLFHLRKPLTSDQTTKETCMLLPMQLRSPAEKGMYAYGGRPTEFSGIKRSGLNSSGSGKYRGSRWRA